MEKPTVVIAETWEMGFKELCVLFKASHCIIDGVKHKLPEKWK